MNVIEAIRTKSYGRLYPIEGALRAVEQNVLGTRCKLTGDLRTPLDWHVSSQAWNISHGVSKALGCWWEMPNERIYRAKRCIRACVAVILATKETISHEWEQCISAVTALQPVTRANGMWLERVLIDIGLRSPHMYTGKVTPPSSRVDYRFWAGSILRGLLDEASDDDDAVDRYEADAHYRYWANRFLDFRENTYEEVFHEVGSLCRSFDIWYGTGV